MTKTGTKLVRINQYHYKTASGYKPCRAEYLPYCPGMVLIRTVVDWRNGKEIVGWSITHRKSGLCIYLSATLAKPDMVALLATIATFTDWQQSPEALGALVAKGGLADRVRRTARQIEDDAQRRRNAKAAQKAAKATARPSRYEAANDPG